MTAADRTRLERRLRRLQADDVVETIYHDARAGLPFDMTYGRRLHALGRLAAELVAAGENLRHAGGTTDGVSPTDAELEAAYRRLIGKRITGRGEAVTDSVVQAVDDVRLALREDYDLELERVTPAAVYPSGASRARR